MTAIKPLGDSAEKWSRRSAAATSDLIKGVRNPRRSWKAASREADENYKTSVIAAANEGRYGRGIDRTSDEKWMTMTESKALNRHGEGVVLGEGAWEEGFKPYQEVIARISLPRRGQRGSASNYQRSTVIGQANNAARLRILAGK